MNATPTPAQFRAARALLGWSRLKTAQAAGLAEMTVHRLETASIGASKDTARRVQDVLEAAGVQFLRSNGVRLPPKPEGEP